MAIRTALVIDSLHKNKHLFNEMQNKLIVYQNLNSGNLRIKGLNSSLDLVGNDGPFSTHIRHTSLYVHERN